MFRFVVPAVTLAIGLPLVVKWAWFHNWIQSVPSFLYPSTWLVAFITTVVFVYLYRLDKPAMFVQFYLLSLVVKILMALGYCLIMALKHPVGTAANLTYFLILYLVFTVLEVALLYRKIAP